MIVLNSSVFAQTSMEIISGEYEVTYNSSNSLIVDKLTLNPDGTFVFHEYDKHDNGVPPERNKYGKGTWHVEKNIISFTTSKADFDEKYTLDFNTSTARFITKLPRDNSNRDIKTSLKFFNSEIPWITGRTLLKTK